MEAVAVAVVAGVVAAIGYLLRRRLERSGETERLRREDLALDVERKRRELRGSSGTVQLVLLIVRRD